jgi:FG-GAP-like repeat
MTCVKILAMPCTGRRRAALAVAAAIGSFVLAAAPSATAATLPVNAEVGVATPLDVAAFERTVSDQYHVAFRNVVTADIDRDGDLDVVAITDRSLVVWVNDGSGHLTAQVPKKAPAAAGRVPATASQDRDLPRDESIQDDGPSTPLLTANAHAPPVLLAPYRCGPDLVVPHDIACTSRTSRAPPA